VILTGYEMIEVSKKLNKLTKPKKKLIEKTEPRRKIKLTD
jgi:hypothetical protein